MTAAAAADPSNDNITSDSYFYGQSPPVYPSRTLIQPQTLSSRSSERRLGRWLMHQAAEMTGGGEWKAAYQKAKALVAQMSLEEKV